MGDSCGTSGQVRHLKVKRTNVAHRLPRGKRAPGTEINHYQKRNKGLRKESFSFNRIISDSLFVHEKSIKIASTPNTFSLIYT
ncbi:hypothetical protein QUF49_04935 [Fictibacillus sp. b24]|uniref:hypothetical protein n=1 Tax=Fictibacillus sp. b24 TaxID=3055863 RepID=UPI0025A2DDDE|nr:hypothetical protein [Fictibacillus sp. b24]MDM5315330.1 hypothetical protein [Fictibacillus sp. b24]